MQHTKEVKGANVLNNAFDTNFAIGDGQPLISTAHPLTGGGTARNRASTMADLNETSLDFGKIFSALSFEEILNNCIPPIFIIGIRVMAIRMMPMPPNH